MHDWLHSSRLNHASKNFIVSVVAMLEGVTVDNQEVHIIKETLDLPKLHEVVHYDRRIKHVTEDLGVRPIWV